MLTGLLKNYKKKLVNLSGSNRSLLLPRISKENDIDLHLVDYLLNLPSFHVLEGLIAGKKAIPLTSSFDSRNEKANIVGRQLQRIDRKNRFLFEESGSKDLYIGWPFVRGKFLDGSLVRCPLLFFPVDLHLLNNVWHISPRESETIMPNKNFLLAWAHYNQMVISDELLDTTFESFPKEARQFKTHLYDWLKTYGLEIHFNSELFVDKLEFFRDFKTGELEEETEIGRLKLYNEAVLGVFPQAGSYLIPDYESLLSSSLDRSTEDFFASKIHKLHTIRDSGIKEADMHIPLAMDASQEHAIKQVKGGNSIVVQGPPGTGKSQLICNLVADYIGRGKRVLVVCQKRAALDVVFKRLAAIGLENFIALVHDFKADRQAVFDKIAYQIAQLDSYKTSNASLDTVLLERNYLNVAKRIDKISEELEQFRHALFNTSDCGVSIKELYLTSTEHIHPHLEVGEFYRHFTFENLLSFSSKLKYLLPIGIQLESPEHPWCLRKSFKNYGNRDKANLAKGLAELNSFHETIASSLQKFQTTVGRLWDLRRHTALLEEVQMKAQSKVFYSHFHRYLTTVGVDGKLAKWHKRLDRLSERLKEMEGKRIAKGVNLDSLSSLLSKTQTAERAYSSLLSKYTWKWFSKDRVDVQALLRANQLADNKSGINELIALLQNTEQFYSVKEEFRKAKEFEIEDEETVESYLDTLQDIKTALFSTEHWLAAHEDLPFPIQLAKLDHAAFLSWTETLQSAIKEVEGVYFANLTYFNEDHLNSFFLRRELIYHALQELDSSFDSMIEFDKAKEGLAYHETQALKTLIEYYNSSRGSRTMDADDLVGIFDNAIRRAWVHHIEDKYPILRIVSTPTLELLEEELDRALSDKRGLTRDMLLLKLREQTYRHEEYNRLGNRTTFRELNHQVSKKKKIWPLRKLLEHFGQEAFYVLPCWLASPETVSAVFPLEELFDLVIFDEASQCYAEKGIPSIARGKQLVIAGDSKQLQPHDLYRTRFYEEDEEVPETEIDSLLELGVRYFPQSMLTEHYRSQSLELIDFSNRHFYGDKLKLLPDYRTYIQHHKGISYCKVDGIFERHCNLKEAEAVVDLCVDHFKSQPDKELGVITFNVHQQNLILDLIDKRAEEEQLQIPPSFLVKNIENIQGDEKDVIFFSIGYAPDASGRMHHHFGSLNLDGGENRLNVAITRAREKIVIVSSIFPQQLLVENTLHKGPKLLKAYLEYAWEVSEGRFVPGRGHVVGFPSSWLLKEKLKKKYPDLTEDLPFADLVKRGPHGDFQHLVLTDDDRFYQSLSTKEFFSYLPSTLRAKHWKFKRAWSRNFTLDR